MKKIEQTITTVEIAEMMEMGHYKVLEKLEGTRDKKTKGIIPTMTAHEIVVSDYFTASAYKDASGKENKCYLVTKLGCDFLANKFTGEKGILFTAKYVKRFHDMEEQIQNPYDGISTELQAVIVVDKRVTQVENRIEKLENNMTITHEQIQVIKNRINSVIVKLLGGLESNAYKDKGLKCKAYSQINRNYCDFFRINARANTLASRFEEALRYIDMWQPDTNLRIRIQDCNAQLNMEVA